MFRQNKGCDILNYFSIAYFIRFYKELPEEHWSVNWNIWKSRILILSQNIVFIMNIHILYQMQIQSMKNMMYPHLDLYSLFHQIVYSDVNTWKQYLFFVRNCHHYRITSQLGEISLGVRYSRWNCDRNLLRIHTKSNSPDQNHSTLTIQRSRRAKPLHQVDIFAPATHAKLKTCDLEVQS